jgi:hypothetical protein
MELFETLLLPSILCALAAFVFGFVWYHPKVMGAKWCHAREEETKERRKSLTTIPFSLNFMLWMIAGFFYSFIATMFEINLFHDLIALSCLLWVGFAMPPIVMGAFYTGYPIKAATIDSAYQLAGYYLFAMVYFGSINFL